MTASSAIRKLMKEFGVSKAESEAMLFAAQEQLFEIADEHETVTVEDIYATALDFYRA